MQRQGSDKLRHVGRINSLNVEDSEWSSRDEDTYWESSHSLFKSQSRTENAAGGRKGAIC